MTAAHPKPLPLPLHHVLPPVPHPLPHAAAAVHTTVSDTLDVLGVGISQGKLIAVFMAVGVSLMVISRRRWRHRRYVPSNPPKDYSSVTA